LWATFDAARNTTGYDGCVLCDLAASLGLRPHQTPPLRLFIIT
jgi:hypothetical protein